MKLYLVHHAHALTVKEDPDRPLSEQGQAEADRIGTLMKAVGAAPERFLHSDKLRTRETAERIAAILGLSDCVAQAKYGTGEGDDLHPFMEDIEHGGDLLIAGHVDHLTRAAARLVAGDESRMGVEFKPGTGTIFCLEGSGARWAVVWGWRQEQMIA